MIPPSNAKGCSRLKKLPVTTGRCRFAVKTTYKIDPAHSSAHFRRSSHDDHQCARWIQQRAGTVVYDPENLSASSIDVTIDANSLNTGDANRDTHVKSADFLDAEKYPTITFKSKTITKDGDGLKVKGDLTIHGVTKEVVLMWKARPRNKKTRGEISGWAHPATTKIKRSDFGLTWNAALETGGIMLGDDLKIELDVSLIKA